MCGRFTNEMTWEALHVLYSINDKGPPSSNMQPRFNIAPTQPVHFAHLDRAPRPKRMSLVLRRELWAPLTEAAAAIGMGQRFEPLALGRSPASRKIAAG